MVCMKHPLHEPNADRAEGPQTRESDDRYDSHSKATREWGVDPLQPDRRRIIGEQAPDPDIAPQHRHRLVPGGELLQ